MTENRKKLNPAKSPCTQLQTIACCLRLRRSEIRERLNLVPLPMAACPRKQASNPEPQAYHLKSPTSKPSTLNPKPLNPKPKPYIPESPNSSQIFRSISRPNQEQPSSVVLWLAAVHRKLGNVAWASYEVLSKLLVSPLIAPIILPYRIPYIDPFKEFRL